MSKRPRSNLQPIRKDPLPARNAQCPCGSGKKAKKCCLNKIKEFAAVPPAYRQQVIVASILGGPIYVEPATATSVETTE